MNKSCLNRNQNLFRLLNSNMNIIKKENALTVNFNLE